MTFAVTLEGSCYTYCARVFFAGGQRLTISGLICHNHKHYDPETMRSARPRVVVHTHCLSWFMIGALTAVAAAAPRSLRARVLLLQCLRDIRTDLGLKVLVSAFDDSKLWH